MKCASALRSMTDLVEGVLGEEESARLRAHLDRCPACERELQRQQAAHSLLKGAWQPAEPPSGMLAAVRERVAAAPTPRRRWAPALALGATAAAAAALVGMLQVRTPSTTTVRLSERASIERRAPSPPAQVAEAPAPAPTEVAPPAPTTPEGAASPPRATALVPKGPGTPARTPAAKPDAQPRRTARSPRASAPRPRRSRESRSAQPVQGPLVASTWTRAGKRPDARRGREAAAPASQPGAAAPRTQKPRQPVVYSLALLPPPPGHPPSVPELRVEKSLVVMEDPTTGYETVLSASRVVDSRDRVREIRLNYSSHPAPTAPGEEPTDESHQSELGSGADRAADADDSVAA